MGSVFDIRLGESVRIDSPKKPKDHQRAGVVAGIDVRGRVTVSMDDDGHDITWPVSVIRRATAILHVEAVVFKANSASNFGEVSVFFNDGTLVVIPMLSIGAARTFALARKLTLQEAE